MHVLDIVGNKAIHCDNDEYKKENACSTAWRNNNNAACGGVGIMLSKVAIVEVNSAVEYSLQTDEKAVIMHYAPCEGAVIMHYAPREGAEYAEEHYKIPLMPSEHNISGIA